MTSVQQPDVPRSFADFAKEIAIMVALSAVIVGALVVLKQVLPPI